MADSTERQPQPPQRELFTGVQHITASDLLRGGIKNASRRGIIAVFTTAPNQPFTMRQAVEASGYQVPSYREAFSDARNMFNWRSERNDWGQIRKVSGIDTTDGANHRGKQYSWIPSQMPVIEDPEEAIMKHIIFKEPPFLPLEALGIPDQDIAAFVGRVAGKFVGEDAAGSDPGMQQRAHRLMTAAAQRRSESVFDAAETAWTEL